MPKLLLHICCGPCAIMAAKILNADGFEISGWFMNPNIQPLAEYIRRREAAGQCAEKLGIAMLYNDVWDVQNWLAQQLPFVNSPQRCERCCTWRLEAAAHKAKQLGISYFSTSLLYSRYQPHEAIKRTGLALANRLGINFVYRDFRVYWQQGIDLSKEWGIYRQSYCGCIFSEAERYAKKLTRLRKN